MVSGWRDSVYLRNNVVSCNSATVQVLYQWQMRESMQHMHFKGCYEVKTWSLISKIIGSYWTQKKCYCSSLNAVLISLVMLWEGRSLQWERKKWEWSSVTNHIPMNAGYDCKESLTLEQTLTSGFRQQSLIWLFM